MIFESHNRLARWRLMQCVGHDVSCYPAEHVPNTVLYLISLIRKTPHKHIGDALIRRFAQKQTSKSKEASYVGMATDRDRTDKRATQPCRAPVRHADPTPCRCLRAGRHEPRAPGGACGGGSVEGWMGWHGSRASGTPCTSAIIRRKVDTKKPGAWWPGYVICYSRSSLIKKALREWMQSPTPVRRFLRSKNAWYFLAGPYTLAKFASDLLGLLQQHRGQQTEARHGLWS